VNTVVGNYTLSGTDWDEHTEECVTVDVEGDDFSVRARGSCLNDSSLEVTVYSGFGCSDVAAQAVFEAGEGIKFRCGEYQCTTTIFFSETEFADSSCSGNYSATTEQKEYDVGTCYVSGYAQRDAQVWCDTDTVHVDTYNPTSNIFTFCTKGEDTYDFQVGDCFEEWDYFTNQTTFKRIVGISCGAPGYEGSSPAAVWGFSPYVIAGLLIPALVQMLA